MAAVHQLHMASFKLAGEYNPPSFEDTRADLFAYLVIAASGDVVLVDTGIGAGNPFIEQRFEPERNDIGSALARFDVAPRDVRAIVNSHLHFDHCGNNACFPHAEVFVQAAELDIAREQGRRYTVPEWFDHPHARLSPVRGDREIMPGMRLLATPGHTPGHQSVLVDGDQGIVIIAAQAAFTADEFLRGGDPETQAHDGLSAAYVDSIGRLKSIACQRVLFSHDRRSLGRGGDGTEFLEE
jgi:N-acyl homoserine lactone hydrolase